ncbi:hypothetical protein F511_09909 [Dorcoceras hygrometricum]|uniref:Uncharacterized protein n=1 Tax=Dorcoceras hygrometricum TaxID=472368 RepID=A0A2Z7C9B3_9LAMI|nr:hypothetical protein F511_09909 [Dorcoceras hygrometricum]
MKPYLRMSMLATYILALVLILHFHRHEAQAARVTKELKETQIPSSAGVNPSSQALKDLQVKEKNPYKKVKSSFRAIPPSRSNPTQNK